MSSTASHPDSPRYVDLDEFIDYQVSQASSGIKTADLLTSAATITAAVLGYFVVFALFDQWVIPGGIPVVVRWVLLVGFLTAVSVAVLNWLVLPIARRVNLLFAARELEQATPGLRSSLLNLLDLQQSGRTIEPSILQALQRQAALQLETVNARQAVDHRFLMRAGYFLLGTVVVLSLYVLLSPKPLWSSIVRILPMSSTPVATRTLITAVEPGDAVVLAGNRLEITADVAGQVPERVFLEFTTSDRMFVREVVELKADDASRSRYRAWLIGKNGEGLLQNLEYQIFAGDSASRLFQVTIDRPPTATVDEVHLTFPAYTKLDPVALAGGSIQAWEGTQARLTATANQAVQSAVIRFYDEPGGKPTGEEEAVTVTGQTRLEASWKLAMREDGTYPHFYSVQVRTAEGRTDPSPAVHAITIRPDEPPQITLLEPERDIQAPANAVIPLLVQARDPDFELGPMHFVVEKNGQPVLREAVFAGGKAETLARHRWDLAPLGLQVGEELAFYFRVEDNRQPRPNVQTTPRLRLTVVAPVSPKERERQEKAAEERVQEKADAARDEQALNDRGQPEANDAPKEPGDDGSEDRMPPEKQPQKADDGAGKAEEGEGGSPENADGKGGQNDGQDSEKSSPDGKGNEKSAAGKNGPQENKGGDNAGGKKGEGGEPGLSPDGEDDQAALEKLFNKLGNKKPDESKGSGDKTGGTQPESPTQQPAETGAAPKEGTGENQPAGKSTPPEQESMPSKGSTGTKPSTGDDASAKPTDDENSGLTPKESDPSQAESGPMNSTPMSSPSSNDVPMKGETSAGESPKPMGGNDQPAAQSPPNAGETPNPGDMPKDPMSGTSKANDPTGKKPQDQNGDKPSSEKGDMPGGESGADGDQSNKSTTDKPPTGSADEGKPNGRKGDGGDSKRPTPGDPNESTEGPKEPAENDDGAMKRPGDPNTKGTAQPDPDRSEPGNRSTNPDLRRDPMTEPARRPAESDPKQPPTPEASKAGDQGKEGRQEGTPPGKNPDPKTGGQASAKSPRNDAQEPNATDPRGSTKPSAKQDGRPDSSNEDMKGEGRPNGQKSDQPQGGEAGSSKQDASGQSGSQEKGPGDSTGQPGKEETGKSSSSDEKSAAGEGKSGSDGQGGTPKEGDGNAPKQGGSDSKTDDQKQNNAADKGAGQDQKPSGGKGQQGKGGEPASGKGEASDKGAGGPMGQSGGGKSAAGGPGEAGSKPGAGEGGRGGTATGKAGGNSGGTAEAGDDPNLEHNRQAAELILKRLNADLEDGKLDPELLEELGWTEGQMKKFMERMQRQLGNRSQAPDTPESEMARRQFEEMLKSLKLDSAGSRQTGRTGPTRQLEQSGVRRAPVPLEYREQYEAYTRGLQKKEKSANP